MLSGLTKLNCPIHTTVLLSEAKDPARSARHRGCRMDAGNCSFALRATASPGDAQ